MTYRKEFSQSVRKEAFARANGVCECGCGMKFDYDHPKSSPVYDHITPAKIGGDNSLDNCKCIRLDCHEIKTAKDDLPKIAKVRREDKRRQGLVRKKATLPGSKGSPWKAKVGGGWVRRDEE